MNAVLTRWCPTAALVVAALTVSGNDASGQSAGLSETPLVMTLNELQEELDMREADLLRYNERLEALESQNTEVRGQIRERETELRVQEYAVRERIVTLCRLSRGGYMQLLGGARSLSGLMRLAQLARAVVDQDIEALRVHQGQVDELEEQRQQLSNRVETQRRLSERIGQYQQELEAERQRRLDVESAAYPQSSPLGVPTPSPTPSGLGL